MLVSYFLEEKRWRLGVIRLIFLMHENGCDLAERQFRFTSTSIYDSWSLNQRLFFRKFFLFTSDHHCTRRGGRHASEECLLFYENIVGLNNAAQLDMVELTCSSKDEDTEKRRKKTQTSCDCRCSKAPKLGPNSVLHNWHSYSLPTTVIGCGLYHHSFHHISLSLSLVCACVAQ